MLTSALVGDVVARSLSVVGTLALVSVVACSSAGDVAICPSVGVAMVWTPSAVDTLMSVVLCHFSCCVCVVA